MVRDRAHRLSVLVVVLLIAFSTMTGMVSGAKHHHDKRVTASVTTAPKWVTRSGVNLFAGTRRFFIVGANAHWLALVSAGTAYPDHARVDALYNGVKALNGTTVRAFSVGASFGCPACIEPSLGNFPDANWSGTDYAIKSARDHGIRLIVPFVDRTYDPGSRQAWVNAVLGGGSPDLFYTDPQIRAAFKTYVSRILNHVGPNGVALKADPTIIMWETGNELDVTDTDPATDWTYTAALDAWERDMIAYIRGVDGKHLILDGHHCSDNKPEGITSAQLNNGADVYQCHVDPRNLAYTLAQAAKAKNQNRAFGAGEYSWIPGNQVDASLPQYLRGLTGNSVDMALFWEAWVNGQLGGNEKRLNVQSPETPEQAQAIADITAGYACIRGLAAC